MPDRRVDILLVGGGVASVRCARTLRREGFDGSIVIVGAEPRAPYNRPPLSKEVLREDVALDLLAAEPDSWYGRRDIQLVTGTTVVRLDPDEGSAQLDDGSIIGFDRALLASGASVRRLAVPGGEEAYTLRTAGDAVRIRDAARTAGAEAPVVVVGGGFIGLEVASGLAALGLRPTVLEMAPLLWAGSLGTALSAWAVERLEAAGIAVRRTSRVDALERGAAIVAGERLAASFVVAGIGVTPADALGRVAGLLVDDGVVVDAGQRTSHPNVWAAGDVARLDGAPRVEHWHAARESGERAARSMLGAPDGEIPVPWVFSEVAGVAIDVVGATGPWDEERWSEDGRRALLYLRQDRLVGLASIGSAIDVAAARRWVTDGLTSAEVAERIA